MRIEWKKTSWKYPGAATFLDEARRLVASVEDDVTGASQLVAIDVDSPERTITLATFDSPVESVACADGLPERCAAIVPLEAGGNELLWVEGATRLPGPWNGIARLFPSSVSPDGRWIAVQADQSGRDADHLMALDRPSGQIVAVHRRSSDLEPSGWRLGRDPRLVVRIAGGLAAPLFSLDPRSGVSQAPPGPAWKS